MPIGAAKCAAKRLIYGQMPSRLDAVPSCQEIGISVAFTMTIRRSQQDWASEEDSIFR